MWESGSPDRHGISAYGLCKQKAVLL